jgi:hydroxymethylbilane synthase
MLKIGTRGSDLALAQAHAVQAALAAAHPDLATELRVIHTTGDKRLDLRLSAPESSGEKVPKGLFTKELEAALAAGEIDLAVHSLKDLPTEMAPELIWAATLPRERTADVLVTKDPVPSLNALPAGALITTSSVRRARLLRHFRPDLALEDIRGNVPTRLKKLAASTDMAGTLLAFAGLHRLGLIHGNRVTVPEHGELYGLELSPRVFLPAVGQGAIGIQARKVDTDTLAVLSAVNHAPTFACCQAERAFLRGLGGSCQTPVGAASSLAEDGTLTLRGLVFPAAEGAPPYQGSLFAPTAEAEALGAQLAREALAVLGQR